MSESDKKTPLYEDHLQAGARMVSFAGWTMPIQYEGLKQEHLRVRSQAGLFDVSHMGEIRVRGPQALESLEWLCSNLIAKLPSGKAQYNLLCTEEGGIVDDVIVYCLEKDTDYLVCVNAANKDKDFAWMLEHNRGADITDESESWAQLAVQGPRAMEILDACLEEKVSSLGNFEMQSMKFAGTETLFARTGYTGEMGGEIFIRAEGARALWSRLLEQGQALGLAPIGLGARDSLRTEMKYPLYGQEIDSTTLPLEAGLGWAVKLKDKEFLGSQALIAAKEKGLRQKLIGFMPLDKGIPRSGYTLCNEEGQSMGRVTSGTFSPSLEKAIGIGYVELPYAKLGQRIHVDIRGRQVPAEVVETPFVKK